MNLWRRSKSWFQDGSSSEQNNNGFAFEDSYLLQQEKTVLNKRHEAEKTRLGKHYHKQLDELKARLESEMRQLEEQHECWSKKRKDDCENKKDNANGLGTSNTDFLAFAKKNLVFESDGLEWDPSDDLMRGNYNEDQINSGSWEQHNDTSQTKSSILSRSQSEEDESCDSAYSSLSTEFQGKFFPIIEDNALSNGSKNDEIERKMIEEMRLTVRQEVLGECEAKFCQERNFLYSIIDELEENVRLLRKQKGDIVTLFEYEEKQAASARAVDNDVSR